MSIFKHNGENKQKNEHPASYASGYLLLVTFIEGKQFLLSFEQKEEIPH